MHVKIVHFERVRFSIQAREHTIVSDQPAENGGQDTGMTPPELLLASLGSCAAYYAVSYLQTRKLAESGVEVTVNAEKLKQPARTGNFVIHVHCPVPLTEAQSQGLLRSVQLCIVHNTLTHGSQIAIELTMAQAAVLIDARAPSSNWRVFIELKISSMRMCLRTAISAYKLPLFRPCSSG